MAKNALQALDDRDLLGAARLISISATAKEHAPGGGGAARWQARRGDETMSTSAGRKDEVLATGPFAKGIFKAVATIGVSLTLAMFTFGVGTASAQVAVAVPDRGPEARVQGLVPDQYIVVFNNDVRNARGLASSLARRHGFSVQFSYQFALKGFSASMPRAAADALANNPNVAYVEQDTYAYPTGIYLPAGVLRIDADKSPQWNVSGPLNANSVNELALNSDVDVDIAIIDTGVADDPDLYIFSKTNCSGGNPRRGSCEDGSAPDGVGHGTHVAGTAAARGVSQLIGVAPGARIWAVKVFTNNGAGYCSWAIAGVDWVTEHANEIEVANMSLSCSGSSQAMIDAIADSTEAGVTYAVSAGNYDTDAGNTSPANAPAAITVSAIADYDGIGGGWGSSPTIDGEPVCADGDDTFATFSNHGAVVDIAAPGVCVVSMWNDGLLYYASGTSMASPHVAGAAALIHAEFFARDDSRPSAADVEAELFARAIMQSDAEGYDATNDGDDDREWLVNLATGPVNDPPTVEITAPSDDATVFETVLITAIAGDTAPGTVEQVEFRVGGGSIGVDDDGIDVWSFSWDTTTASEGDHTLSATATDDLGGMRTHSITVTVDNDDDPPSVTLTNPGEDDSVSGTVTVTADATADAGLVIAQVEFFVDGSSIYIDTNGSDGWSLSWDTTLESDGPHTVSADATDNDASGSQTGSDSVTVTVNNSVSVDAMYVYLIEFKKQGPNLSITVTIRLDSDGIAGKSEGDAAAAGANIAEVLLTGPSGNFFGETQVTTDSSGKANYKLVRAASGEYTFEVLNVTLNPHVWSLDSITDNFKGTCFKC